MHVRALLFLPLLAPMTACGGSGGGSVPVTLSLPSEAAIDGTLSNLGALSTTGTVLRVGDEDFAVPGSTIVSFVSFDLAAIPAQAQVTDAVLRIRLNNMVGEPEVGHGDVQLDDVDIGASLDAADPTQVFASAVATLVDDDALPQFVTLTDRVAAAVAAGRTRFQLRLRYQVPTDADGANDWANYISGNSSVPENVPLLTVTYEP
jgi:hypothetical protein